MKTGSAISAGNGWTDQCLGIQSQWKQDKYIFGIIGACLLIGTLDFTFFVTSFTTGQESLLWCYSPGTALHYISTLRFGVFKTYKKNSFQDFTTLPLRLYCSCRPTWSLHTHQKPKCKVKYSQGFIWNLLRNWQFFYRLHFQHGIISLITYYSTTLRTSFWSYCKTIV